MRRLHRLNLEVGIDAVLTNSFGATSVTLAEYDLAGRAYEINAAAARLARESADAFSARDGRPRWVAGSMGPGTKLPTLGQIDFDTLSAAYREQARGLLDEGVDVLLVETVYDLLQGKAAIIGAQDAFAEAGRETPIFVSVTIETTGQMLVGSEIGAAVTALAPLGIDALGINCATGPELMHEHLRYLSRYSPLPILCQPNAGLPRVENDQAVYDLSPAGLRDAHRTFVGEYGVALIGGCCGTTPAHMAAVVEGLRDAVPAARAPQPEPGVASLFTAVPYDQDASVLIVGERANANGSRRFKRLLEAENFDEMANVVRDQAAEGAHIVDVCVDYVGRDGAPDMERLIGDARGRTTLPIMLDSTEAPVLEAGLKLLGGKPILNSINLEDGGARLDRTLRAARRYGAAVVALVIDEDGQARTADRKLAIAHRIYDLVTQQYGLPPEDLFFDALTLPLGSGQEELRNDGRETLEAVRRIKAELPGVHTILGVSNVSFGLNPAARQVLNSVFLHRAVDAGLDAAIVNAQQILPEHQIDPAHLLAAQRLIDNEWIDGPAGDPVDPLHAFLPLFTDASVQRDAIDLTQVSLDERLHHRILDGLRDGLTDDLEEALTERPALSIINDTLLPAMQVVGDLFGAGKMQLPFVLQSAETMKAAVAYLEPHMEKSAAMGKGKIILATVRGDVHDIGKNLVEIILGNNGFQTVNLGIKQPIANIIDAADAEGADAIGLSGLLVKSTVVMKEDLQELNRRGLAARYPVLLGGAALTRRYVEQDLRDIYDGAVYYGQDAFEGLEIMNAISRGETPAGQDRTAPAPAAKPPPVPAAALPARSAVASDVPPADAALLGPPPAQGPLGVRDRGLHQRGRAVPRSVGLPQGRAERCRVRGVAGPRRPPHAATPDPGSHRARTAGARRRLRLLPGPVRRRRADRLRRRHPPGTPALRLPAPARQAAPLPGRLLPLRRERRDGRGGLPRRHGRGWGQRLRRAALRRQRLPGVPLLARLRRRDGRGAGRVLARPRPPRAGHRRRRRPGRARPLRRALPGRALQLRLPGLPQPGGPGEAVQPAATGGDRRHPVGGVPARARAVDQCDHHGPPRGGVLQYLTGNV